MQTRKPPSLATKKESRQHRDKAMQHHCSDCKQTTQENTFKQTNMNQNIKH